MPKAAKPGRLGASTLVGLRHHLRPWAGQFPVGQIVRAVHDDGRLCAEFGVSPSTGSAKARAISDALKLGPLRSRMDAAEHVGQNPLVWMAEVNGYLVDLRTMPREVQEIAFEKGLIPYIPDDRT